MIQGKPVIQTRAAVAPIRHRATGSKKYQKRGQRGSTVMRSPKNECNANCSWFQLFSTEMHYILHCIVVLQLVFLTKLWCCSLWVYCVVCCSRCAAVAMQFCPHRCCVSCNLVLQIARRFLFGCLWQCSFVPQNMFIFYSVVASPLPNSSMLSSKDAPCMNSLAFAVIQLQWTSVTSGQSL